MSKRPLHPNGIDRLYPDCYGNYPDYAIYEEQCPKKVECPGQAFEVYTPVSVAECDPIPPVKIPHVSVKTKAEARAFPNHYVFVEDTGEAVHIDEYGNAITLSRTPMFKNNFDADAFVGVYKTTEVYDFAQEKKYIYNPAGQYAVQKLEVPMMKDNLLEDF